MATPSANNMPVNPDTTFVTVKVAIDGTNRRFKLALRDLGANVFPDKIRFLLGVPADANVTLERYSDSAATYVILDSNNPAIYKQLYRAAKAKLKLRIKATIVQNAQKEQNATQEAEVQEQDMSTVRPRSSYLDTVLDHQPSTMAPTYTPSWLTIGNNATTETLVQPEIPEQQPLAKSCHAAFRDFPSGIFCIDCNNCGNSIPNEHYHCSLCDDGDFDLCMDCVEDGELCSGEGHWLIKRTLQNGRVVSSVTETIAPKHKQANTVEVPEEASKESPAAQETKSFEDAINDYVVERTCNSCIGEFPNSEFVSCTDCYDFDLCENCLVHGQHGHNPAHKFVPLEKDNEDPTLAALCMPGRNVSHAAICDSCDKKIFGVRHKCLDCPDFDYCSECVQEAPRKHSGHRFAPLYEPIAEVKTAQEMHYGIYCDGPLCQDKARRSYIRGVRYKCAVCHDTDFCASCEAVPTQQHNRTHPLIKFKSPVKHVSVTTVGEDPKGQRLPPMGDRIPRMAVAAPKAVARPVKTAATETIPVAKSTNAATQVQTMADFMPYNFKPIPAPAVVKPAKRPELEARFVSDLVTDGTVLSTDSTFTQVWTMTNPGPETWPSGCSVRFTGGDWMLNVDSKHPSSVSSIHEATETNVTERPVKAGESIDFKIVLKTPSKEGRIISYWRLKGPDGTPFGHKLWCDVSVRAAPEPEVESTSSYVAPTVKEEQEEEDVKAEASESTMIFPKLDKESPVSSMHEEVKGDVTEPSAVASAPESVVSEVAEDLESLALDGEETDEGFLTDEEYDILDASDEEFLDAAQQSTK